MWISVHNVRSRSLSAIFLLTANFTFKKRFQEANLHGASYQFFQNQKFDKHFVRTCQFSETLVEIDPIYYPYSFVKFNAFNQNYTNVKLKCWLLLKGQSITAVYTHNLHNSLHSSLPPSWPQKALSKNNNEKIQIFIVPLIFYLAKWMCHTQKQGIKT